MSGEAIATRVVRQLLLEVKSVTNIQSVYRQIADFARERGIERVILFGSRARGQALPKSDIDIAVQGCGDFAAFEEDVNERLWSLLSVDIVNLDGNVSAALREDIERDGKVIYEKI